MTNHELSTVIRPHRLAKYLLWTTALILIYTIVSGIGIYIAVMTSYSQNYQNLVNAGFHDLIISPAIVSQKVLIILTLLPAVGIGIVSPMILKAIVETHRYQDEVEFIKTNPHCIEDDFDAKVIKLHKQEMKIARK